jgi:hypothetical protein
VTDPADDGFLLPTPPGLDPALYGGAEQIDLTGEDDEILDEVADEEGKSVSRGLPLEPLPEPARTTGGVADDAAAPDATGA